MVSNKQNDYKAFWFSVSNFTNIEYCLHQSSPYVSFNNFLHITRFLFVILYVSKHIRLWTKYFFFWYLSVVQFSRRQSSLLKVINTFWHLISKIYSQAQTDQNFFTILRIVKDKCLIHWLAKVKDRKSILLKYSILAYFNVVRCRTITRKLLALCVYATATREKHFVMPSVAFNLVWYTLINVNIGNTTVYSQWRFPLNTPLHKNRHILYGREAKSPLNSRQICKSFLLWL